MTLATDEVVFKEGDPEMPPKFRELLIRMLSHHLENSTNPNYTRLLNHLWERCMELAPNESVKVAFARLMFQEVEHGVITAKILEGLGAGPVNNPIKQYLFHLPIETFCDLAYFHCLGDRVGMYVGETWDQVPYEPLLRVAPKLHKDEMFHCTLGLRNVRLVCETPEGVAQANQLINKWWPAALDMFGRSDSDFSPEYVKWGLRKSDNDTLRRKYISDTRPLLEEIGITVPPDEANRRFL